MNDELPTQHFANVTREGWIVDGNGKHIGVAFPSAASPGELVLCLDEAIVRPYYGHAAPATKETPE